MKDEILLMLIDRKAGNPAGEFYWEHLIWYQNLVNDINCAAVLHRCQVRRI